MGGGLAGLSAAIEALGRNSKVLIIDSEKNLGGNSAKASSGGLSPSLALFLVETDLS